MLDVASVASSISINRRTFSYLFLLAQSNLSLNFEDRIEFESVTFSDEDKIAFKEALDYAMYIPGLYKEMMRLLFRDDESLSRQYDLMNMKGQLQHITDKDSDCKYVVNEFVKFRNLSNFVGHVLINGESRGSGTLISPGIFLTAWHVVSELFIVKINAENKFSFELNDKSDKKLQIEFTRCEDLYAPKVQISSVVVDAAEDWLEDFSACHAEELQDNIPEVNLLIGYYDYVTIRLAKPYDNGKIFPVFNKKVVVPEDKKEILVAQYPQKGTLTYHVHQIVHPPLTHSSIPTLRFLHSANTVKGSSGSPVFNEDFHLVGIHQGVWIDKIDGELPNRGVPMRNILLDIEAKQASKGLNKYVPYLEKYFLIYLKNDYRPVIAIEDFQRMLLTDLLSGNKQILIIQGKKGSGKSYCVEVLFELFNNKEHLKVIIPTQIIAQMDCKIIASYICQEAGTGIGQVPDYCDYYNTIHVWLKSELLDKAIKALDAQRRGRTCWICFMDINRYNLAGEHANEFLLLLYEATLTYPWLRLILDGQSNMIPENIFPVVRTYTTRLKHIDDIELYIEKFTTDIGLKFTSELKSTFSLYLFNKYKEEIAKDSGKAMEVLNREFSLLFNHIIQASRNEFK